MAGDDHQLVPSRSGDTDLLTAFDVHDAQVRTGLPTVGRRIRTAGPTYAQRDQCRDEAPGNARPNDAGSHLTLWWRKGDSNSRSHPDGELSQRVVLVDICDGDTDGAPATTADRGTQLPTHLEAAAEEGILANPGATSSSSSSSRSPSNSAMVSFCRLSSGTPLDPPAPTPAASLVDAAVGPQRTRSTRTGSKQPWRWPELAASSFATSEEPSASSTLQARSRR